MSDPAGGGRPAPVSARDRSTVVARLRAAGCVFAEDEARLLVAEARGPTEFAAMVDQRVAGRPLEHVVGWAEFCGLRVAVDPGVFVPRRRTELVVREAAATVTGRTDRIVVVDLCCGSGAVGVALMATLDQVELHAVDVDSAAVDCARRNVMAVGGQVYAGDLYQPLPLGLRGRADILVANAPYVPTDAIGLMPPEARDHEPGVALDGGEDGLDVVRRVVAGAREWLAPGGHLLVETSERQASAVVQAFAASGLGARVARDEELGGTVVVGADPRPQRERCRATS